MHPWWAYETSFKMYYWPQTLSILLQSHEIPGRIFRLHWSNKFSWVCSESGVYLDPEQKGQHRPVHYSWRTERENTEQCLMGLHLWCTFGPPAPRGMSSTVSQADPTTLLKAAESLRLAGMLAEHWKTQLYPLRGLNITLIYSTMPMLDTPPSSCLWFGSRLLADD